MKPFIYFISWLSLIALMVVTLAVSGCAGFEAIKSKSAKQRIDHVTERGEHLRVDSNKAGVISQSATLAKSQYEGERITYQFLPAAGSTQAAETAWLKPATVVVERWNGSEERSEKKQDSSFYQSFSREVDSRFAAIETRIAETQKEKQTKSKGIGFFPVAGALLGLIAAGFVVRWLLRWVKGQQLLTLKTTSNEKHIT